MTPFLIRWFVTTIAVSIAAKVTGIHYGSVGSLLGASLLLGIINALVRPILLLLSLPFIMVTLGFFILIVNALLFWFAGSVAGLQVDGFWTAFFAALIVSIVSWIFSAFFRTSDGRYHVITHHGQLQGGGGMKSVEGRVVDGES